MDNHGFCAGNFDAGEYTFGADAGGVDEAKSQSENGKADHDTNRGRPRATSEILVAKHPDYAGDVQGAEEHLYIPATLHHMQNLYIVVRLHAIKDYVVQRSGARGPAV